MKYQARITRLVTGYMLTAVSIKNGDVYSEYEVDQLFGTAHQAQYYWNNHKLELVEWL